MIGGNGENKGDKEGLAKERMGVSGKGQRGLSREDGRNGG